MCQRGRHLAVVLWRLLSRQYRGCPSVVQRCIKGEDEEVKRSEQSVASIVDDKTAEAEEEIKDTIDNSVSVEEPPGSYYDDVAGMCMPENSDNLLGYEDESLGMSIPYETPYYTPAEGYTPAP